MTKSRGPMKVVDNKTIRKHNNKNQTTNFIYDKKPIIKYNQTCN